MVNDTFCILPWIHMYFHPTNGTSLICCAPHCYVTRNGTPISLYKYALEEIYNSDYLRDLRKKMISGEKIPFCNFCYEREKIFGSSMRSNANKYWFKFFNIDIAFLEKHAHATNFAAFKPFTFLRLDLGIECNLKCRICTSERSIGVLKDSVHNAWCPANSIYSSCWFKDRLTILPTQIINGTYKGFYDLNFNNPPQYVWTDGNASIEFDIRKNTELLQLVFNFDGKYPAEHRLKIEYNSIELFNKKIDENMRILKFDISSLPREGKVILKLNSSTFKLPCSSRKVGVCLKNIQLVRYYRENSHPKKNDIVYTRFPDNEPWYKQEKLIFGELLADLDSIKRIHFTGGEPLVMPMVKKIVDFLVSKNVAKNIHLSLNSNFTVAPEDFLKKMSNFKKVVFYLSLDAVGKVYEYMRYPASWRLVRENLLKARKYEYIEFVGVPVIAIYNALEISELCRFFDELKIGYDFYNLEFPAWLRLDIMPPGGRKIVSERLRKYAENLPPTRAFSKKNVLSLAGMADNIVEEPNEEKLRKFMLFTNDLDFDRKQSIKESIPELYQLISDYGFKWTSEVKYARQKNSGGIKMFPCQPFFSLIRLK